MTALPFPAPVLPLHHSLAGFRVVAFAHRAELHLVAGLEALHQAHEEFFHGVRMYLRDDQDAYLLVRGDEAIGWHQAHTATLAELARHADNERLLVRRRHDDLKLTLRARAAAPLKPAAAQAACDVGLFSDDRQQLDLVDMTRRS